MKWLGNATEVRQHKKVAKRSQWVLTHNIRATSKRTLVVLQIDRPRSLSTALLYKYSQDSAIVTFNEISRRVWSFVLFAGTLYVWSFRAKTFKGLRGVRKPKPETCWGWLARRMWRNSCRRFFWWTRTSLTTTSLSFFVTENFLTLADEWNKNWFDNA